MTPAAALTKVRAALLAMPDVTERLSHGRPAWFVGKKQCAAFSDNHHGDGRLAVVCAAPDGMQAMLVDSDPDAYYVPPYVGTSGWVGVRLDRTIAWAPVARILEAAHACARVKR